MIDFADRGDIGGLTRLWEVCFDAPKEYTDFYFGRRFDPSSTLVWREADGVKATLTLMRVTCGGASGFYVYAVATLPDFRGRGLMTRLEEAAADFCRRLGGSFLCLVPAEASLFSMYEKLSYRPYFPVWRRTFSPEEFFGEGDFSLRYADFETFFRMREAYLEKIPGAVGHPKEELRYIYEELFRFSGGVFLYPDGDGALSYAAANCEGEELIIREFTGSDPERIARFLLSFWGGQARTAQVRSPRPFDGFSKTLFGMGKPLKEDFSLPEEGYMALMLD